MDNLQFKMDTARNLAFATEQALMTQKRELKTLTNPSLIKEMEGVIKDGEEVMAKAYKQFEEYEMLMKTEEKMGVEISGDVQAKSIVDAYWKSKAPKRTPVATENHPLDLDGDGVVTKEELTEVISTGVCAFFDRDTGLVTHTRHKTAVSCVQAGGEWATTNE